MSVDVVFGILAPIALFAGLLGGLLLRSWSDRKSASA